MAVRVEAGAEGEKVVGEVQKFRAGSAGVMGDTRRRTPFAADFSFGQDPHAFGRI